MVGGGGCRGGCWGASTGRLAGCKQRGWRPGGQWWGESIHQPCGHAYWACLRLCVVYWDHSTSALRGVGPARLTPLVCCTCAPQNGAGAGDRIGGAPAFPWPKPEKPMMFWAQLGPEEISASGACMLLQLFVAHPAAAAADVHSDCTLRVERARIASCAGGCQASSSQTALKSARCVLRSAMLQDLVSRDCVAAHGCVLTAGVFVCVQQAPAT